MEPLAAERRTQGVQRGGRAARVVASVVAATAAELTRVGYGALRIEEVARRAGVNKTTVYRRWPTKAELVCAAARALLGEMVAPDTGSLRGDLIAYLWRAAQRARDPKLQGLLVTLNSRLDPELEALVQDLRNRARQMRVDLVRRGIERGELPRGTDPELVAEIVSAPILHRVLHLGEDVDEAHVAAVVDLVLAGAAACAVRPT
ncbi:MAG: hypothetical protein KatS3mg124_1083 [Porticoccaceae bacterium]|nr:MAG: hypothetical protein KatS3mg124_1083 [Porticoccaceae bacterium]